MRRALLGCTFILIAASAFAGAKITVRNADDPGVGLNDPTPATAVGGNSGATLGEQRLIALQQAADIWSRLIDSNVEITIDAHFKSLTPCDSSSGVLAQASPMHYSANFDNAPKPDAWYPIALANKFAQRHLSTDSEITATFNADVDNATCLGNTGWYYGLDDKHGTNVDIVTVALHEFGHGLGIAGTYNSKTGALLQGRPGIFEMHTLDGTTGLRWDQMTDAQRLTSQTNDQNLVWDGETSRFRAARILGPSPFLRSNGTTLTVGSASFGSHVTVAGLTGNVAAAADEANETGPSTTDACTPLTNTESIIGRVALIDRGSCAFVVKAKNAQDAGAIAAIVIDNVSGSSPPGLGGSDPSITIPVVSVTKADGDNLRAQAGLSILVAADPQHLAGADANGFVKLYAPSTFAGGSSVHHWDTSAFPNLLMEPNISSDLSHDVDVTIDQLIDIGWTEPTAGRRKTKR